MFVKLGPNLIVYYQELTAHDLLFLKFISGSHAPAWEPSAKTINIWALLLIGNPFSLREKVGMRE